MPRENESSQAPLLRAPREDSTDGPFAGEPTDERSETPRTPFDVLWGACVGILLVVGWTVLALLARLSLIDQRLWALTTFGVGLTVSLGIVMFLPTFRASAAFVLAVWTLPLARTWLTAPQSFFETLLAPFAHFLFQSLVLLFMRARVSRRRNGNAARVSSSFGDEESD